MPIRIIIAVFLFVWTGITPVLASGFEETRIHEVVIDVKTRKFLPDLISLNVGEKTRFILRNKDAELHAFVPIGLFAGTAHNVSGNGAPQFGKEGLVRVLLPSTGQTEILFTPKKPGKYPFFCDLPGHVMRGDIVVRE
ncbi:MAG: cupredoxin domain-containing protein [Nitrospirales bacterium]|nr:cupredoxin domain-containing protein [Nitrospira sp.]MDR4501025.1 cupredoxin domain-containing protein [Nitrospirales bacterium]